MDLAPNNVFGICANVISDRALRTNAKVWINYCNGDAECPIVLGLSKSGRWITKYTHYKRLTNFRVKWVPEHMREQVAWRWSIKEDAERRAHQMTEMWSKVRAFSRDGTILI